MKFAIKLFSIFFVILVFSSNLNAASTVKNHKTKQSNLFKPFENKNSKLDELRKNQLLIKFTSKAERKRKKGRGHSKRLKRFEKKGKLRMKKLAKRLKRKSRSGIERWHKLDMPKGMKFKDAKKLLANDPDIEYVEPNFVQSINLIPNDPQYSSLWGMNTISAPTAWESETGSADVIVAVIDTGVDYTHEDLKSNMWRNFAEIPNNQIDDDGNGYIDDVYGYDFVNDDGDPRDDHAHGTHVAGTIAATGNNAIGVTGVNWNTRIMALKFLNGFGMGYADDAIKAIEYAAANGAHIINASWGGGGYSQAIKDAIDAANEVLFVAAAGNSGENTDETKHYPSSYDSPNIISVAALAYSSTLAGFSNYGTTTVDIAAPGRNIMSSVPTTRCQWTTFFYIISDNCDPSGYRKFSGTSMAAPHVAGAAALLKAFAPGLSTNDLKTKLLNSVDKLSTLSGKMLTEGRVNVFAAIENASADKKSLAMAFSSSSISTINAESITADLIIENNGNFDRNIQLKTQISDSRIKVSTPQTINLSAYEIITLSIDIQMPNDLPKDDYQLLVIANDEGNVTYHSQLLLEHDAADFQHVFEQINRSTTIGSTNDHIFKIVSNGYNGDIQLKSLTKISGLSVSVTPEFLTLSPGTESEFVVSFSADESVPYGAHRIYLQASDGNTVRNLDFDLLVFAPGRELVMDEYSLPSNTPLKLGRGNGFKTSYTITNYGNSKTNFSRVGVYLSDDPIVDRNDKLIAAYTIFPLSPGQSEHKHPILASNQNIPTGNYYIAAIADDGNGNREYNEDNNVSNVTPIKVINDTDVIIETIELPKNTLNAGETFTVPFTVTNIGTVPLNSIQKRKPGNGASVYYPVSTFVGFYLSEDANIDTNDQLIATHTVAKSINGGESINEMASISIPVQNTMSGKYYIGAIVNPGKFRLENNYENNVAGSSPIDLFVDIDLVAKKLSLDNNILIAGEKLNTTFTIENTGTTNVDKVTVYYYLSGDEVLNLSRDRSVGSKVINNINAGSSIDFNYSVYPPTRYLTQGKYYLFVRIDGANPVISDKDKTNNVIASEPFDLKWDVDVSIVSVSYDASSAQSGTSKTATVIFKNFGTTNANGRVYMQAHLSKDAILSDDDIYISNTYVSYGLSGGRQITKTIPTSLPDVSSGNYQLIFSIASRANWYEKNTDNNSLAGDTFSITNDVNLQFSNLTAGITNYNGLPFNVSYAINNTGTMDSAEFNINYYLSTDNIITTDDTYLTNTKSLSILSGSFITDTKSLSLPTSLAAGDYYIGAVVDPENAIMETNESDNISVSNVISVIRNPDLIISTASADKLKVSVDDSVSINYSIDNIGGFSAPKSLVQVYFGNILIKQFWIESIPAGQKISGNMNFSVPYYIPTGLQELKFVVDGNNGVAESNEDNNTSVVSQIEMIKDVDLVVNSIDYDMETITPGEIFLLNVEIQNSGTTKAASKFDVYLKLYNADTNSFVRNLRGQSVYSLNANQVINLSWDDLKMPNTSTGNYFIQFEIAKTRYFRENAYDNNILKGSIFQVSQNVDVSITQISIPDNRLGLITNSKIDYTINNAGSSSIDSLVNEFYLSVDKSYSADDIRIGYSRVNYSNPINPTSSVNMQASLYVSDRVALGNYYVIAVADPINNLAESDESNNVFVSPDTIEVFRDVDLTITQATFNLDVVDVNSYISIPYIVTNLGESAAYNVYIAAKLGDKTLDNFWLGTINPGSVVSKSLLVRLYNYGSYFTNPGIFDFKLIVDYGNTVIESNEDNNAFDFGQLELVKEADLTMNEVTLVSNDISSTNSITVSSIAANIGKADIVGPRWITGIYLSKDNVITTDDIFLKYWRGYTIKSGKTQGHTDTLTLPSTVEPGTYYIGAIADMTDKVNEIDETNNSLAGVTITIP